MNCLEMIVMAELYTLYRRDAEETSIESAEKLDTTKLETIVLNAIASFHNGCISDEVRAYCENHHNIVAYSSVTARYKSLKEKELIEYLKDAEGNHVKRAGNSGRNQKVMVLKKKQMELPWNTSALDLA
jgi:glutamate racemase